MFTTEEEILDRIGENDRSFRDTPDVGDGDGELDEGRKIEIVEGDDQYVKQKSAVSGKLSLETSIARPTTSGGPQQVTTIHERR